MGCNTSQEALAAVENKAEAVRAKTKEAIEGTKQDVGRAIETVKTSAEEEIGK